MHGSKGAWQKFVETAKVWGTAGETRIDWENDKLIFVQVFRGHTQAGHWSLLVIDRTVSKHGILVFFDLLPDYFPDIINKLKCALAGTPLALEGCTWIHATMPKQGFRTNDCGVFMSCIAALYTKGLIKENRLSANSSASETIFTDVEVRTNFDSTDVGWAGRDHM
jgi:Ulp1 family protease